MKKILLSLMAIVMVGGFGYGATRAYFTDTETSNNNTFTAGTMNLALDGQHSNVQKFDVTDMKVGERKVGTWEVNNVGTTNGYLNLHNITVVNAGGLQTDAEEEAGDANNGNLGDLLMMVLFVDNDGNGIQDGSDSVIYLGKPDNLTADKLFDLSLPFGQHNHITMGIEWQPHTGTIDNTGQGDQLTIGMTFELSQVTEK